MSIDPAVSVIVPTHARPVGLRRCLQALETLTSPPGGFEVVVVDDGTPGGLGAPADDWTRADVTLTIVQQGNAGPAAARNRGVQASRGDIVAFTDDDCAPDPAWLVRLTAPLDREPDALIGGSTRPLTGEPWLGASEAIIWYLRHHAVSQTGSGPSRFLPSNNLACRRDRFDELGGFDASFPSAAGEDRDFSARWRQRIGPLRDAPEAVVAHGHDLSFRRFVRQHFGYGRGSARFRSSSSEPESRASFGFAARLVVHPLRRNDPSAPWGSSMIWSRRLAMSARLLVSQIAVAAGVLVERLRPPTTSRNST